MSARRTPPLGSACLFAALLACSAEPGADAGDDEGSGGSTGAGTSTGGDPDTSTGGDTGTDTSADTGAPLEGYDDPALWLCHPDKAAGEDHCRSADLTATKIHADGTTEIVEHSVAADPAFDCFYVYPTVDRRLTPGQTEDFEDISEELDPLLGQAARLSSQCRVFAPLYHQVTIGSFGSDQEEELLQAAYADVEAAFASYLERHGGDRPFVILGHSQGTRMTTQLIQELIEPDPDLRARMIVAVLLGGWVAVPEGELVGGSFTDTPLCSAPEETGCVLAWRSYAEDLPPTAGGQPEVPAGQVLACTNPGSASNDEATLRGTWLAMSTNQEPLYPPLVFDAVVDTPFVIYPDFFAAQCQVDVDGQPFLAISIADPEDPRPNPIDFEGPLLSPGFLGLHSFDHHFASRELLDAVAGKAAAHGG